MWAGAPPNINGCRSVKDRSDWLLCTNMTVACCAAHDLDNREAFACFQAQARMVQRLAPCLLPPSITSVAPLIQPASPDNRNMIACATSVGSPSRLSG